MFKSVPLMGHTSKSMPMMHQQSTSVFRMKEPALPIGGSPPWVSDTFCLLSEYFKFLNFSPELPHAWSAAGNPFATYSEAAAEREDSYQKETNQRTVFELLAETVSSGIEKSASEGALAARSKSLQKSLEVDFPEVPQGSNSVPINTVQFVKAKGMQTHDRLVLQSSIARYASSMKSRMFQASQPVGVETEQMPSLWSKEASNISPCNEALTQQKSNMCLALGSLLRPQKGLGRGQRASRTSLVSSTSSVSQPRLTKHNSLASIAERMKATSADTLSRTRNGKNLAGLQGSKDSSPSTSQRILQLKGTSQGGLSKSTESSCSFTFLANDNASRGTSGANSLALGNTLNFDADTLLQRPPTLSISRATSRSSNSGTFSSRRVSNTGLGKPGLGSLARASSSPLFSPDIVSGDGGSVSVSRPRRRTMQEGEDGQPSPLPGFHGRQALTPIRSGEIASFVRPTQPWQPMKSAFAEHALQESMVRWSSESDTSTAAPSPSNTLLYKASDPVRTTVPKISGDGSPWDTVRDRLKRMCSSPLVGSMLGRLTRDPGPPTSRPRGLSDGRRKPTISAATRAATPEEPYRAVLEPGLSAPASFQEACDKAIAAVSTPKKQQQHRALQRKASGIAFASIFARKGSAEQKAVNARPTKVEPPSTVEGKHNSNGLQMRNPEELLSRAALRDLLGGSLGAFVTETFQGLDGSPSYRSAPPPPAHSHDDMHASLTVQVSFACLNSLDTWFKAAINTLILRCLI